MHTIPNRLSTRAFVHAMLCAALSMIPLVAVASKESPSPNAFEWVESVPEGTSYGLPDTARTAPTWLSMVRGAKDHIDIAAFYLSNPPGAGLAPVIDALVAQGKKGVRINILVDSSFMHESQPAVDTLKDAPGITVRQMPVKDMTGGVLHVKFMEVDGRDVFVGSQNWDWRAIQHIHEVGARISDPRIGATFQAEFDHLWHLAGNPADARLASPLVPPPSFEPVTELAPVVIDGAGQPSTVFPAFSPDALQPAWLTSEAPTLALLLGQARKSIRLQVMTLSAFKDFGPKGYWGLLDAALRDAAARGVKVQVIVADWALRGQDLAYLQSLAVLPGIEIRYSTVPQATSGPIPYARVEHAKYVMVDDELAFVGTGNWSWSYFESTVDASLFIHGPLARPLGRIFDADWNGPYVKPLKSHN
ncbi:phosphatidylserine/phosphatidylglycerophosphate/cardiolipin synthase-like enzyme [Luteibacter jiangsuensis]|uniref:Phosphatidylserine/phosphatidylglycerophosphate/ cardiolipin synthase-like enzyme n=1 Tax=Luteibacter jiangsuensis TaxID=637577 RepID=A0ABT9SWF1_9GAMM|nr:phospholipase D-like domain-containing protein [Luteibacter jiangsuensis]MDQ0008302.1 phosphatidylserine/phosphatidylglycerophosphate/cardiolipin synthase-like enzyme [Luteibacter jiangsuensis]